MFPCDKCKFFQDLRCKKGLDCSVAMDIWYLKHPLRLTDACSFLQPKKEKLIDESELFRILRNEPYVQLSLFGRRDMERSICF